MAVSECVAWYLKCDSCANQTPLFKTSRAVLDFLNEDGWKNKQFYQDKVACEVWSCPECLKKDLSDGGDEVKVETEETNKE